MPATADLQALSAGLSPAATAGAGQTFRVSGNAIVRNVGPSTPVLADISFELIAPPDCTLPAMPDVVQNQSLNGNSMFVSRVWFISCAQAGPHSFTLNVNVSPDPLQNVVDPDGANNGATAAGSTTIN